MKVDSLKTSNTQRAFFLILFFTFLFFGWEVFAQLPNCDSVGWNREDCTVDIYYEDPTGGSNLDKCEYVAVSETSPSCPSNGTWDSSCGCSGLSTTTCPVAISISSTGDCYTNGEGACKICSKVIDTAGNTGYGELSLNIDYTAPDTTIECDGTICSAGWYNADISITLVCLDSHSGCDKTYYCIDQTNSCSPGVLYADAFDLTTEGTNYVRYYSTDIAGNVEPTDSKTIKLDKTGPYSEMVAPTPVDDSNITEDFDVYVEDHDRPTDVDNSGLSICRCTVYDSGDPENPTKQDDRACGYPSAQSFTVTVGEGKDCRTEGGTCQVWVYAIDAVGNPGSVDVREFNIRIDVTPPASVLTEYLPDPTNDATPSYSGVSTDAQNQVVDIEYRIDGGSWTDVNSFTPALSVPFTFTSLELADGTHTFEVRAKDEAENWEQPLYPGDTLTIDTEPPTVGLISPTEAVKDESQSYTFPVSDTTSGADSCVLQYVDGEIEGLNIALSDIPCQDCTASFSYAFSATGTHTFQIVCDDLVDNATGRIFNIEISEFDPLICNISVPDAGIVNQWIEINVSGSQGAIESVKFSSDNNLNSSPDGGWDGPYDWNVSSGNWNATLKTMKWSFAGTGNYEVWAEVKDKADLTASCYDTIEIMECWPNWETRSCWSTYGCEHIQTCTSEGTWPTVCGPTDECSPGDSQTCDTEGIKTCTDICIWGTCVFPPPPNGNGVGCLWPPDITCDICWKAICDAETGYMWECQPDSEQIGNICGGCSFCNDAGNCVYQCWEGPQDGCECIPELGIDNWCIDCLNYYDPGGPTCGSLGIICSCGPCERRDWSCVDGQCVCDCSPYDETCPGCVPNGCQRDNPGVVLSPAFKSGNVGVTLTYDISVSNNDLNCDDSTFTLTTGEICSQTDWTCLFQPGDLITTSLTIPAGQSDNSLDLAVESPSNAPNGDKYISVSAYDYVLDRSGYGSAIYRVLNNPPSATNLSATPNGSCFLFYPYVELKWEFSDFDLVSGDYQSAREVEIFSDSGYTNLVNKIPEPDLAPGSKIYVPNTGLDFNTTYYWRVRVWDSENALSDCGQSNGWCYPEQLSFRTEKEWPWPDFSVTPPTQRVYLKEKVEFTDESTCYDGPCNLSPTADYLWEFGDGGTSSGQGNASHVYLATGNYDVTLTITDEAGECTSNPITITVTLPLPEWMEIAPY